MRLSRPLLAGLAVLCGRPAIATAFGVESGDAAAVLARAGSAVTGDAAPFTPDGMAPAADWDWHLQGTGVAQWHPGFAAAYSGANSLDDHAEIRETLSFDLYAGVRLWKGAEAHADALAWQGFGLSSTLGAEGFPNGEAFRLGTRRPDATVARLFFRQTFNFGGVSRAIDGDALHLAGRQAASRLVLTAGKLSAKDIFDNNRYANDPRTQFLNWAFMANEAWDYPSDSLGYMTGFAAELYQPGWAVRYGVFQMPPVANGMGDDPHFLKAWGMVAELERDYAVAGHPGAVRLLVYRNRAHMGSYQGALDAPARPADIVATRAYRTRDGLGLNWEQEVAANVGLFSRLGWNDGRNETWTFADVQWTATFGLSVKGAGWGRAGDTLGLAGAVTGIAPVARRFFAAGGTGILAGDGALSYGTERDLETYYDFMVAEHLDAALDYQFIVDPAYNRARGPVSVFGLRVHWEY